ncbi:MAG: hypothetical protein ACPGUD_14305 [Parashewanella sp.]
MSATASAPSAAKIIWTSGQDYQMSDEVRNAIESTKPKDSGIGGIGSCDLTSEKDEFKTVWRVAFIWNEKGDITGTLGEVFFKQPSATNLETQKHDWLIKAYKAKIAEDEASFELIELPQDTTTPQATSNDHFHWNGTKFTNSDRDMLQRIINTRPTDGRAKVVSYKIDLSTSTDSRFEMTIKVKWAASGQLKEITRDKFFGFRYSEPLNALADECRIHMRTEAQSENSTGELTSNADLTSSHNQSATEEKLSTLLSPEEHSPSNEADLTTPTDSLSNSPTDQQSRTRKESASYVEDAKENAEGESVTQPVHTDEEIEKSDPAATRAGDETELAIDSEEQVKEEVDEAAKQENELQSSLPPANKEPRISASGSHSPNLSTGEPSATSAASTSPTTIVADGAAQKTEMFSLNWSGSTYTDCEDDKLQQISATKPRTDSSEVENVNFTFMLQKKRKRPTEMKVIISWQNGELKEIVRNSRKISFKYKTELKALAEAYRSYVARMNTVERETDEFKPSALPPSVSDEGERAALTQPVSIIILDQDLAPFALPPTKPTRASAATAVEDKESTEV